MMRQPYRKIKRKKDVYKRQALYYLAQAYRKNNDLETAKTYYQKIVELYPGTERAANAQNYINIEAVSYTHLDVYKRQKEEYT